MIIGFCDEEMMVSRFMALSKKPTNIVVELIVLLMIVVFMTFASVLVEISVFNHSCDQKRSVWSRDYRQTNETSNRRMAGFQVLW